MKARIRSLLSLLFLVFLLPATAGQCRVTTGSQTVALLELYTSEGCSSCPPADRWLSHLRVDESKLIPLALHVDYWDYIGWNDRFAQSGFSQRQRWLVGRAGSRTVYTPQTMVNGKTVSWRNDSAFSEAVAAANRTPARARIDLELLTTGPQLAMRVKAEAAAKLRPALYLALYENGLSNQVSAGENNGVTLRHDYVTRQWWGPLALQPVVEESFTLPAQWQRNKLGVVAWVQNQDSGEVLQATRLALCP